MELSINRDCNQRMIDSEGRLIKSPQNHYDSSLVTNFLTLDNNLDNSTFVIMPRSDYEHIKKELLLVKQSFNEFQNLVNFEIQQLKQESSDILKQVEKCKCEKHQAELFNKKNSSIWNMDNGWENRPFLSGHSLLGDGASICSPNTSTPDRYKNNLDCSGLSDLNHSVTTNIFQNHPKIENMAVDKKLVQLLPHYEVYVNKLNLQIIVNEGISHKENGALYVLRRLIPLVFTWDELAYSRGQGLNCKSSDNISNKFPLDPTRVVACKAYMRKFCMEAGCPEPTERAINQTFSHQVNYARRRVKEAKEPKSIIKTAKKSRRDKNNSMLSHCSY